MITYLIKTKFFCDNKIINIYRKQIENKILTNNNKQLELVKSLNKIHNLVLKNSDKWLSNINKINYEYRPIYKTDIEKETKKSFLDYFFKKEKKDYEIDYFKSVIINYVPVNNIDKGIYIVGNTGSGKTYLMDMMSNNLNYKYKLRIHFNEFMLTINKLIFKNKNDIDPLFKACCDLARQTHILFIDEFQVTDIGDAVLMDRVFNYLWKHGTILITTSNRIQDDLYKNGIQRETFIPFIDNLKNNTIVEDMMGVKDYRIEIFLKEMKKYKNNDFIDSQIYSIGEISKNKLNKIFQKFAISDYIDDIKLEVIPGRNIIVKGYSDVFRMSFEEFLIEGIYGASDFISISRYFSIFIIDDIKKMKISKKDLVKKFILLIDELYNYKVKIFFSSESDLDNLFIFDNKEETEESFMIKRCISRLIEMKSKKYFNQEHIKII